MQRVVDYMKNENSYVRAEYVPRSGEHHICIGGAGLNFFVMRDFLRDFFDKEHELLGYSALNSLILSAPNHNTIYPPLDDVDFSEDEI